jgi:hypothetical protein
MIVLGAALQLPQVVMIIGIGLIAFAVVLAVVALAFTVRLRTTLILSPQSITDYQREASPGRRVVHDRPRQNAGSSAVVDH